MVGTNRFYNFIFVLWMFNLRSTLWKNYAQAIEETKRMLKQLREAISDIIELIRQDNLNYLK